jgi:protoporphyrinogen oxidase
VAQRLVHTPQESFTYDTVLFSAALPDMAALTEDAPDEVRTAAQRLRAADVLCLNLGLREQLVWPYSWVYFPSTSLAFFRLGVYSNVMPSMAPVGQSAIYVEITHRNGDVADLKQRALEDLGRIGLLSGPEDITADKTVNIKGGYALYDKNHAASSALIADFLARNNCLGMGRYGRWEYGDMEDSFLHAAECLNRLL